MKHSYAIGYKEYITVKYYGRVDLALVRLFWLPATVVETTMQGLAKATIYSHKLFTLSIQVLSPW